MRWYNELQQKDQGRQYFGTDPMLISMVQELVYM